jgi:polysaccharide deacetylase 2 family uncharacterized protein YibQ
MTIMLFSYMADFDVDEPSHAPAHFGIKIADAPKEIKKESVKRSPLGEISVKPTREKSSLVQKRVSNENMVKEAKISGKRAEERESGAEKKICQVTKRVIVGEEYPADEMGDVDFGLVDLINREKAKTEGGEKSKAVSTPMRPKLAIIIDDISHRWQMKRILSFPYHITPSIFPPSELSSTSNKLAKETSHHMVHLPMQSASRKFNSMRGTLFVYDSNLKVKKRIEQIRTFFPETIFLNNHTGSVFTSDYKAMKRLYGYLRENGFIFIDSRTTGRTAVRRVAREYGDPYISRDIFIDNVQSRAYILGQLRKAVSIAKKRGYAIAIGHPHKATFDALRHAENILRGVDVVYMDELYDYLYGDERR